MLMKFIEDYKYSNNGYQVISAKAGEEHEVEKESLIKDLIKTKVAIAAEDYEPQDIEEDDTADETEDNTDSDSDQSDSDDDNSADDDNASEDSVEPDDLTELHKIGPALAEELNAAGITTFAQLADELATEAGRQFVIDLRGITENDIPRIEDQLVALLEDNESE